MNIVMLVYFWLYFEISFLFWFPIKVVDIEWFGTNVYKFTVFLVFKVFILVVNCVELRFTHNILREINGWFYVLFVKWFVWFFDLIFFNFSLIVIFWMHLFLIIHFISDSIKNRNFMLFNTNVLELRSCSALDAAIKQCCIVVYKRSFLIFFFLFDPSEEEVFRFYIMLCLNVWY